MSNNLRNYFIELRHTFDPQDPFMSTGHQIRRPRVLRPGDHHVPKWAQDDKQVQKILLLAFPKLGTDSRQRHRAGRWLAVIHLYFRMSMTTGQVAYEMGTKPKNVENVLASIRRVARNHRADNKGIRGLRGRGRPKKVSVVDIETTQRTAAAQLERVL